MEQLKKTGLLISFLIIVCFKSYSQDTAKTVKKTFKIYPSQTIEPGGNKEVENLPKEKKPLYSSEIDRVNKKVILSYLNDDGTIRKETYDLIEEKK